MRNHLKYLRQQAKEENATVLWLNVTPYQEKEGNSLELSIWQKGVAVRRTIKLMDATYGGRRDWILNHERRDWILNHEPVSEVLNYFSQQHVASKRISALKEIHSPSLKVGQNEVLQTGAKTHYSATGQESRFFLKLHAHFSTT